MTHEVATVMTAVERVTAIRLKLAEADTHGLIAPFNSYDVSLLLRMLDEETAAARRASAAAIEECARERSELLSALMRLTSDVSGCWRDYEAGLREAMGNTNYAVIEKFAGEARDLIDRIRALAALPPSPETQIDRPSHFLQWARETFGDIALDAHERTMRFVEEAIELAHAMSLESETVEAIIRRVYSRPFGLVSREIGQCLATLELLASVVAVDADQEATAEFARVKAIPKTEWDRRHKAKVALGIAKFSAPETQED